MGRKNSEHSHASEVEEDQVELTIEEEVEKKIKQLPTLKQKVHAIAINHHILEKRRIETELSKQMTKIELEFRKRYAPLLEQINNIVSGSHNYADADFEGNTILTEEESNVKHNYYKKEEFSEYWFKALISNDVVGEEVRQIDEALIKHLLKVEATRESENSLKIVFTFSENEWFTNTTLTKEFELEGEQIKRSFGDEIAWKEGKNITIKTIKKKGKNKKKTVQKEVESFFNFFKEIDLTEDDEEEKDEAEDNEGDEQEDEISKLERQYEIANEFYENLVPKSLEYFLGVVGADFGDLAGLEGIEQGDEEDEQQEEPKKKKGGKKARKGSNASSGKDQ